VIGIRKPCQEFSGLAPDRPLAVQRQRMLQQRRPAFSDWRSLMFLLQTTRPCCFSDPGVPQRRPSRTIPQASIGQ